jgi:hypothetical protein
MLRATATFVSQLVVHLRLALAHRRKRNVFPGQLQLGQVVEAVAHVQPVKCPRAAQQRQHLSVQVSATVTVAAWVQVDGLGMNHGFFSCGSSDATQSLRVTHAAASLFAARHRSPPISALLVTVPHGTSAVHETHANSPVVLMYVTNVSPDGTYDHLLSAEDKSCRCAHLSWFAATQLH